MDVLWQQGEGTVQEVCDQLGRPLAYTTVMTTLRLLHSKKKVLKRVKPEIVVAPHPYLDTHPDHQYVTVALAEALDRWKKPARFLLYTNHAGQNQWPFGPPQNQVPLRVASWRR